MESLSVMVKLGLYSSSISVMGEFPSFSVSRQQEGNCLTCFPKVLVAPLSARSSAYNFNRHAEKVPEPMDSQRIRGRGRRGRFRARGHGSRGRGDRALLWAGGVA